jgi:hypothetical protein
MGHPLSPRPPIRIGEFRFRSVRVGPLGVAFAALTFLAALVVMLLLVFGKILALSALVSWLWPRVFSQEMTRTVFGTPRISFWKVLLLFTLAAAFFSLLRRRAR